MLFFWLVVVDKFTNIYVEGELWHFWISVVLSSNIGISCSASFMRMLQAQMIHISAELRKKMKQQN